MTSSNAVVKGKYNDIHPEAKLGEGTVVWSWNYIGRSKIGKRCKISNFVHIGNGCVIGDDCNFQPYVCINDGTQIGNRVFFAGRVMFTDEVYPTYDCQVKRPVVVEDDVIFGAGVLVRGAVHIGKGAVLGIGGVVLKDVSPNAVMVGVPAKPLLIEGRPMTRDDYERKKIAVENP